VGNAQCGIAAEGAITECAFDAAGHLARERHLQDYVDADGSLQCRWVETIYTYNLREQLVEVAQSHLSDPDEPGQVNAAARRVMKIEYDAFGRMLRHSAYFALDGKVDCPVPGVHRPIRAQKGRIGVCGTGKLAELPPVDAINHEFRARSLD
jgi:hypothetical protein